MRTPENVMAFYKSATWRRAREMKISLARGVCERCGKVGTEVHHRVPLTSANVTDLAIAIGMDNLELLCKACHDRERSPEAGVRDDIEFDAAGNVIQSGRRG